MLAAEHLPEMYEASSVEEVLSRLQARFTGAFEFSATVGESGNEIRVDFERCALKILFSGNSAQVGCATACLLFHEYWAGLLSAFSRRTYAVDRSQPDGACSVLLRARS